MSTGAIIGIVVAVVVIIALVAVVVRSQTHTRRLRSRFGGEYERLLREHPKREAERELVEREKRHAQFELRTLSADERERYTADWAAVQERFVDRPAEAVEEADRLVTALMADRGYPLDGDADQRFADLSVRHSSTVEHYRLAHAVRLRQDAGDVSTEDLREAIVRYRSLFQDLLGDGADTEIPRPRTTDQHANGQVAPTDHHAGQA